MKILPNSDIECCDPDCATRGITSVKGDLPLGWTFRRVPGNDEESVLLLIYCPTCSRLRDEVLEVLRRETVSQTIVDGLSNGDPDLDPIPMPTLDRQHLRREAISRLLMAEASISLAVMTLKTIHAELAGEAREIRVQVKDLIRKLEDGDADRS